MFYIIEYIYKTIETYSINCCFWWLVIIVSEWRDIDRLETIIGINLCSTSGRLIYNCIMFERKENITQSSFSSCDFNFTPLNLYIVP